MMSYDETSVVRYCETVTTFRTRSKSRAAGLCLGAIAEKRVREYIVKARDAVQLGAQLNASLLAFGRRQTLQATSLDAHELMQSIAQHRVG